MSTGSELATTGNGQMATIAGERLELLKRTIAKGVTDDELALFVAVCNRTGLDPFARQIYAVTRWDKGEGRKVMTIQISIDGLRLLAQRSGHYAGQLGPLWCGQDGQWVDVWLSSEPPAAAKVGVLSSRFSEPLWAVARWASYVQKNADGGTSNFWARMPDLMLGKVAEALALRRAFPAELSGLYIAEEMAQATTVDSDTGEIIEHSQQSAIAPRQRPAPQRPAPPINQRQPIGPDRAAKLQAAVRTAIGDEGYADAWLTQQLASVGLNDASDLSEVQGKTIMQAASRVDTAVPLDARELATV